MKVTTVPAQITTIEDRIAGNLGLSQLLLLTAPVFIGSGLYIILPPTMHSSPYKLVIISILLFMCCVLSIRIKGKILLLWLVVILKFNLRPRYYLYNKNSLLFREDSSPNQAVQLETEMPTTNSIRDRLPTLSTAQAARVRAVMENPAAHLSFEANPKGGLRVRITEVK